MYLLYCAIVSPDALNNGNHTSSAEKPLKTEETSTEALPELLLVDKSKQISSVETPSLKDVDAKQESCEEVDNSTNSALDDSVMAVYGGKDETFMENSTLDQSVDMSADQTNLACNSTSNSSTLDIKEEASLTVQDNKASLCNNEKDASAQESTAEEPETGTGSDVALSQDRDDKEENKTEVLDADIASGTGITSGTEEEKKEDKMEVPEESEGVQDSVSPSKDGASGDKSDRGSKRQRDR